MASYLSKAVIPLFVSLTFLTLGALFVGRFGSLDPTVEGFMKGCDEQAQPCWYGIIPGITTIEDAKQAIQEVAFHYRTINVRQDGEKVWTMVYGSWMTDCAVQIRHRGTQINMITLTNCSDVRVGDLMQTLGKPNNIRPLNLTFHDEAIYARAGYQRSDNCPDFSPFGAVDGIWIYRRAEISSDESADTWQGFQPYDWYVKRGTAPSCATLRKVP
jgi:hypothetical protein